MKRRSEWEKYLSSKKGSVPSSRPSKYGNVWTTIEYAGKIHRFQSKKEALRARELLILQSGGEISSLGFQPVIPLIAGITYIPDFIYQRNGTTFYEDSKGKRTAVFNLKLKLLNFLRPEIVLILS